MSLREDTSLFISTVGAVVTGALSWFLNSPLLGVVTGVFLGTGVSVYVQSRTQRRAWKREVALKNIDTVYAPLYRELNAILSHIDNSQQHFVYGSIEYPEWTSISSEYYYHIVSETLRKRLDSLYEHIKKYNQLLTHLTSDVSILITQEASAFYKRSDLREITLGIWTGPSTNDFSQISITNAILFGKDPRDIPHFPSYSYIPNPQFAVLLQVPNKQGGYSLETLKSADDLKQFAEFLSKTIVVVQKSDVVRETQSILRTITSHCKEAQSSLLQLIQQPLLI